MTRSTILCGLWMMVVLAQAAAADQREMVASQLVQSREKHTTMAAWTQRRNELRKGFLEGAGLWPVPARTPLNVIIHSRRQFDGYSVENVALETIPGFYCTGNLYRPLKQDQPGPAILCPHGHFKPLGRMRPDQQIRCAQFARMGATVFSYSMVGWQDSQQTTHDDPLVLALQTWNSIRALDYVSSLPNVDPQRIGVTGASGGATQTFFVAALDDRVAASAPVVIVYPWASPAGCKCEGGLPVMQATQTNAIELAASVAPRPQLLISCGGDETRDFPEVGFPFIRHVYGVHEHAADVENVHFADEAHDYGPSKRKAVYAFFAKHLRIPFADEDVSKITIEPPEKMAVFDEQHPLPPQALHGGDSIAKAFRALERRATGGSIPVTTSPAAPLEGESFFFVPPGFEREGKVAYAKSSPHSTVKIKVRDATKKLTPCRINVIGSDGNFYQPASDRLSSYALTDQWPAKGAWGNRKEKAPYRYLGRFFYSTGEVEVPVIPGQVRIEVSKGFEFQPQAKTLEAVANQSHSIEFELDHAANMTQLGYFSGDMHLHLPRANERDEQTILDLMGAEDIRYGAILSYNEPAGPYAGFMDRMDSPQQRGLGKESVLARDGYSILSGQEYRTSTYGHLLIFLRNGLVFPEKSFNADLWPVYGNVGKETRDSGGYTVHAHGGYAQEIYADAALGTVDGVELLQFGIYRGIGLSDWYHMLNSGYRFPCLGSSDWPACRFLGDCKTYVHAARDAATPTSVEIGKRKLVNAALPSFSDWLTGAVRGESFVTTGPLLLLEVDGQRPGARVKRSGDGPHHCLARVRVRSEVTPVTRVELIVNGQIVQRRDIPRGQQQNKWFEFEQSCELKESAWIAARAYSTTPGGQSDAEAHTNPVFVYLNGKSPYRQASLDAWVDRIDSQIAVHRRREFSEKSRVLDYFQHARDFLLTVRQRGGLRADDEPAKLSADFVASQTQSVVVADASVPDPTDAELKEFLRSVPPKKPVEAIRDFDIAQGFRLDLVAAEPLVFSPVAAAFDEDGALYVCEMRDYPYKPSAGQEPIGSVRLLRDVDGDGDFDKGTVFADKLLWAAGAAPWKGGVFVAASPDIWYLKDTDGDDRADLRLQVYTGFGTDNQQAMVNNLVVGVDHKIYGTTAGNGGVIRRGSGFDSLFARSDPNRTVTTSGSPTQPKDKGTSSWSIDVSGRDFRFDPVTGQFETISGTVQFGNTFDDWGNRFVCSESQPLQHIVLPQEYLARNPYLPVPSAIKNIAPGPVPIFRISPVERWRQIRSSRRIAKGERSAASAGASHHVVDAAAGVTVYRGGAFPPQYYGTVFVGDGQNNLVHHRRLVPDGVTFQSQRVEERTEFLRSSDIWFRPVNFLNAPDGTLYCIDMSREVLESIHIPLDVVKHLDLTSGRDHGRIYRMAPQGFPIPPPPRLSHADGAQLVAALASPHGWWRDTAQRLIYERQDKSLVPALEQLAAQSSLPHARVGALWSLQGLSAIREEVLLDALNDVHPGVRGCALRLAESRFARQTDGTDGALPIQLAQRIVAMTDDDDARVRLQVAFTLGAIPGANAVDALGRMARRDAGDIWMRTAILSSVANCAPDVFAKLVADESALRDANCLTLLEPLAEIIGAGHRDGEVEQMLRVVAESPARENTSLHKRLTLAFGRGLKRSGLRLPAGGDQDPASRMMDRLAQYSNTTALNSSATEAERVEAIALLGVQPYAIARAPLSKLLSATEPMSVQIAAVRALSDFSDPSITDMLIQPWQQYAPDVRAEALHALLATELRTIALLHAAEQGMASVTEIDLGNRERLSKHRNQELRELATRTFQATTTGSRVAVVADYRTALGVSSDAVQGEKVFEKHCAGCHQLNGKGFAIGPNLASSPARDPESLLTHILDPNQYVLPNYVQYAVVDKQGRIFTGMLSTQSATSITLKRERDATDTILRLDLEEMSSMGKSLMPEGLEKNITKPEMANLVAFLRQAVENTGAASDTYRERDFGTLPGLIEPGK